MIKRTTTHLLFLLWALSLVPACLFAQAYTVKSLLEPDYDSRGTFLKAIDAARINGASEQLLLETQIVFPFNTGDFSFFRETLPLLEKSLPTWDFSTSEVFKDKTGLQAMVQLMRAWVAMDAGDKAGFEKAAKEAFWMDPALSAILSRWITEHRKAESMLTVRMPMDLEISTSSGERTSLAKLVTGKKAVLLDFWATWCGPCVRLMPELMNKDKLLTPQGVVVAGMNTEDLEKAEKFRSEKEITLTNWLVEPADRSFSKLLQIDSIPRMVLVSPDGSILYNGHPADQKLEEALAKIGIKL